MSDIKIGLIGGTGLGDLVSAGANGTRHEVDTPFGPPSDAIIEMNWEGLPVLFLSRHGQGHLHNPSQVPYRANIFALKKLGCTHIIASGAVGSLRDEFKPRDLVIADQIIDKTHKRSNTFFDKAAVHVEFAEPFCPVLRRILLEEDAGTRGQGDAGKSRDTETGGHGDAETKAEETANPTSSSFPASPRPPIPASSSVPASSSTFTVHNRGCYVCMEGPAFSTRAESLMHRLWGGDLIGMTCMPEAKLAREAEMAIRFALVTDYDCWRPHAVKNPAEPADPAALLNEIIANVKAASDNAVSLIHRVLRRIAANPQELAASPALQALKLAIWSDKSRIPKDQVELLGPLWMKYFGEA